ncbi:MAG: flavodoxin family protein [Candidatus Brocadia sp. AMX2]|jgi:multimeric flavodoxin WrbA|uniref:NADPH-dependent FMN reductase n=1 Tax=Candidatus Brocadia sinica JPN1 TaxID=1197129 RepID=A0ABQ0JZI5_9BACT|nr:MULTISPECIES: flavodoxin family protein [Brocadia]MBC6931464.1 flavodoxin family protein [Candidatus Brocadia sp.]MBL1169149.1 flavodoxin family protein [Candidatus Brocadia sp. AMX1]MCK6468957.1 flavodoxin family protein [Candidatus Brocadia sinica]NOG41997.1 flavodoxin family protein [Planctomycetota bacterium]KAA0244932.1 MAG: flavodoxin family protein [Candidatus Brocadia sp. AMX2]
MRVLGISGSPIYDSNTDRALKVALEATGLKTEFIKLANYSLTPCRACLGCVKTNRCVNIRDDGVFLAEKAKEADALIVACYTPYSTIDSLTKAFLERLYPLRHIHGFMAGKPGGAIVTCAVPDKNKALPPAGDMGVNAIMFYMMEEGMNFVGAVKISGNVPCIKCGYGNECKMSGVKMMFGSDATVESVGINKFENQQDALNAARELGRKIAKVLRDK